MIPKPCSRLLRGIGLRCWFAAAKDSTAKVVSARKKLYELEYAVKREVIKQQFHIDQSKTVENMFRQFGWSVKFLEHFSKMSLEKRIGSTYISLLVAKQKPNIESHEQLPMNLKKDPFFNQANDPLEKTMAGNEELRSGVCFDRTVDIDIKIKGPQRVNAKFKISFVNGVVYLRGMEPFTDSKTRYPGYDKVDPSMAYFEKDNEFYLETSLLEYLRLFGVDSEFCDKLCATSYYLDIFHKAKFFETANTLFESS